MMSVAELYEAKIKRDFCNYYEEHYEGMDFEEFKEIAIEEMYNSTNPLRVVEQFNEIYSHLVFFLKIVNTEQEDLGYYFKEWDNPQKVFECGMYFFAKEVLYDETANDLGLSFEPRNSENSDNESIPSSQEWETPSDNEIQIEDEIQPAQ